MNYYHVRTNRGLESILAAELRALISAGALPPGTEVTPRPAGRSCWVAVGATASAPGATRTPASTSHAAGSPADRSIPPETFARLRTAYEVIRVTDMVTVQELTDPVEETVVAAVRRAVTDARLPPGLLEDVLGTTFAARCLRDGRHAVQSPTIEREAGTIIGRRTGAAVNLTAPDVTVRVDISDTLLVIGEVVGAQALDRRFEWIYRPRITLSTVVAAAALYLADMPDPERPVIQHVARREVRRGGSGGVQAGALLDPFCGSGTIAIEAASWSTAEHTPIYASDLAPEAVAGTRANAACNELARRIIPRRADATQLSRYYGDRGVTTIVCNPPFGVRLGKRINFDQFYDALLSEAAAVLPVGGRMVLLSSRRRGRLNRVVAESSAWDLLGVHLIEIGGVFPGIFVLERR
ncbi:MAG: THUMP domain-containing protein [Alkalispirochaeta sp.]